MVKVVKKRPSELKVGDLVEGKLYPEAYLKEVVSIEETPDDEVFGKYSTPDNPAKRIHFSDDTGWSFVTNGVEDYMLFTVRVGKYRRPEEIEELKALWRADPNWDIEDTEGFEAYRDELASYHRQIKLNNLTANHKRLSVKADELGIPGNVTLAAYIEKLEATIKALSDRLDNLESNSDLNESVKIWSGK